MTFMISQLDDPRELVVAGGLMSYGSWIAGALLASIYVGLRKHDNPADLPLMQSIKFKLVINLKIAKGTRGWKMTSTHSPAPTGEIE